MCESIDRKFGPLDRFGGCFGSCWVRQAEQAGSFGEVDRGGRFNFAIFDDREDGYRHLFLG